MNKFSNKSIAELLRNVSAVYQIQSANQFQIRAYDLAADSIEHFSTEIKGLWENDKLEESVSLAYYSMYNISTALFFKVGIKCENHSALIILLKEIFEIDNSDILTAKKERIDKQYYTDFSITKEEVKEAIEMAEEFEGKIRDFISRLSNDDVEKFKNKFEEL